MTLRVVRLAAACLLIITGMGMSVRAQAGCTAGSLEAGRAAAAAQNYAVAVGQFTCALQADPANTAAHQGRISAALFTRQYGLAIADVNYLMDNAPEAFDAFLATAVQEANFNPRSVEALTLRAFLYWARADDELAVVDLDSILQLEPNNRFALLFRGSSSQYLGDVLLASDDFDDAVEHDPDNPHVYSVIGSTYAQTGEYDRALQYLDQALRRDPNHARAHYFIGYVLLQRNQLDAAIASLTRAIDLDGAQPDPYYDRGLAYGRLQNYSAALLDLNQALALEPRFRLALVARGRIHDLMGDERAALDDYSRYIDLNTLRQINAEPLFPDLPVTLAMEDGILYRLPLQAAAGQVVTITAESPNDLADPLLLLLDPSNVPVAANDDVVIGDYTARIEQFTLPVSGVYLVLLTHSDGGYRGRVDIVVSFD
ncbi:MAG: tetratricopeptide repeat protein [Anaerolinea sp.]|nr:tetratricopeptide repeat protein [Anaerolinea sp.]